MSPSAVDQVTEQVASTVSDLKKATLDATESTTKSEIKRESLKLSGVLDQFKSFDVTPVIGKEFPEANVVDWLKADNADELLRDLAITSKSMFLSFLPHCPILLYFRG
jgi:hypothetical protein